MSTVRRIARNTAVLLVAQVATYSLAFFYMIYTARYLGPASFGILSFALAFTGIFAVFGNLGLGPLTVREVARDKSLAPKYLANVSLMKIILVATTFGLIALTINLMGYPQEVIKVVYLLALFVIFQAFTQMFYSIFQAFERMEFQAIGQVLNSALMLGGVVFAIKHGFSILGFASLYVLASVIALGYSFAVMRLKFSNTASASAKVMEFDWSLWKSMIKEALPFFLSATFSVIAFRIDMVMLSTMKGDMAVGWYSGAQKIILLFAFIPSAFSGSIYPVLSNFYISSQESLKLSYEKSFKYMAILGLPVAVGTIILADKIILIIYQSGFAQSISALQVLACVIPFTFLTHILATTLNSINRQDLTMRILLLCMVSNIAMNLLLIPRYSYVGAATATVITDSIQALLCFHFLSKLVCKIPIHRFIAKPAIASIIMGLFIFFFIEISFPVLVCGAIVIYFGILFLLKTFSKEDLNLFKQAFGIK